LPLVSASGRFAQCTARADSVEVDGTLAEDGSVMGTSTVVQEAEEETEVGSFCRAETADQHPVGAGIAETYGVE